LYSILPLENTNIVDLLGRQKMVLLFDDQKHNVEIKWLQRENHMPH
jgi:hypothetical protein